MSHKCGGLKGSHQTLIPHSPWSSFLFRGFPPCLIHSGSWKVLCFSSSMPLRMAPLYQANRWSQYGFLDATYVTNDSQRSKFILSQFWWLKSTVSGACLSSSCLQGCALPLSVLHGCWWSLWLQHVDLCLQGHIPVSSSMSSLLQPPPTYRKECGCL